MLKTIIGKLKKKKKKKEQTLKPFQALRFLFLFFPFKLKRLTQNPKVELKRLWVGLNSGTK